MKKLNNLVPVVISAFLVLPVFAGEGKKGALEREREGFLRQIKLIESRSADGLARWRVEYLMAMTTLARTLDADGAGADAAAVRKEIERFKDVGNIPLSKAPEKPGPLATARRKHALLYRGVLERRADLVLAVAADYRNRLQALQKEHAEAGRANEAIAVAGELHKLHQSELIRSARELMPKPKPVRGNQG